MGSELWGEELVVLGLGLLLAVLRMRVHPKGSAFDPLVWGLAPLLAASTSTWWAFQTNAPWVLSIKTDLLKQTEQRAIELLAQSGQDAAAIQVVAHEIALGVIRVTPAVEFVFRAGLLVALVFLARRILAKQAWTSSPKQLALWTAPLGLTWLVLAPGFWLLARSMGWATANPMATDLALNILVIVAPIFLFQGALVVVERIKREALSVSTRFLLAGLALVLALSPVFVPSLVFLGLLGLFEPWMDFRRLTPPPARDREA